MQYSHPTPNPVISNPQDWPRQVSDTGISVIGSTMTASSICSQSGPEQQYVSAIHHGNTGKNTPFILNRTGRRPTVHMLTISSSIKTSGRTVSNDSVTKCWPGRSRQRFLVQKNAADLFICDAAAPVYHASFKMKGQFRNHSPNLDLRLSTQTAISIPSFRV